MPHAGNATNLSHRGGFPHSATTAFRHGDNSLAAAVSLARARPRRQGPRRCRDGPAAARQARHRRRAGGLWPHRRCAGAEGQHGSARHPAGSGDRLWPAARRLRRVRRAARCIVRQGAAARRPHRRAAHLPASARAQPALPSRSPDRCAGPRDRSRLAGHSVGAAPRGVQRGADVARAVAGHRDHLAPVRLALRRDHIRRGGELRRLHHELCRLALAYPPHDERHRQRRQHQGARQPAELRDGEVFRQRAARGRALRHGTRALRTRRGARAGVAEPAEHRPGVHHRSRPHADHADGDTRGARRHDDRRAVRAGQHLSDAALSTTRLPRHGLHDDQAGPGGHGADVPPARGGTRNRRSSKCRDAARARPCRRGAV